MNSRSVLLAGAAAAALGLLALLVLRLEASDSVIGVASSPPAHVPAAARNDATAALSAPSEPNAAAASTDARRGAGPTQTSALHESTVQLDSAVAFLRALLPDRFGKLTLEEARALTTIDLGGARLRDGDLAHLAALPALDSVSLRGSDVTDAGLADLRAVANLKSVDLRGTKATELGVLALPTDRLEALHLTDSAVNVQDLRWLPAMPKLEVFKLNGLAMTDAALADLDFLPALRHLEVDRTAVSDDGLRRFLARNPTVKRVELRGTSVTAATIEELALAHPGLELVDGRNVPPFPPR